MLFVSSLCTIQSLLYSQDEPKLIACIRVWKRGGGVGGKSKDFFDGITWFLGNGGGVSRRSWSIKGEYEKLTEWGGIIRILKSLEMGSGNFYCDTTKILRPFPPPPPPWQ